MNNTELLFYGSQSNRPSELEGNSETKPLVLQMSVAEGMRTYTPKLRQLLRGRAEIRDSLPISFPCSFFHKVLSPFQFFSVMV